MMVNINLPSALRQRDADSLQLSLLRIPPGKKSPPVSFLQQ